MTPKLKIYYQTQQNIHDILFFNKGLTKKKWKKYTKKWGSEKLGNDFLKPVKLKTLYNDRLLSYRKFNSFYGYLKKKQLKKQYNVLKKKTNVMDHFLIRLEKRLDIFLFRSTMFKSLFEIQQLISHKKIKVNWKTVNIKNYQLNIGDCIYVCPEIQKFKSLVLPPYMEWNNSLNLLCLFKDPEVTDIYYTFSYNKNFILDFLK